MWPDFRERVSIYPAVYIIDCKKKGNVVRFYLGNNPEYCGNGWGKYPYEDNAEPVRKEYILGYKDISFPFDSSLDNLLMSPSNTFFISIFFNCSISMSF